MRVWTGQKEVLMDLGLAEFGTNIASGFGGELAHDLENHEGLFLVYSIHIF